VEGGVEEGGRGEEEGEGVREGGIEGHVGRRVGL
jgi:hypothetical protein